MAQTTKHHADQVQATVAARLGRNIRRGRVLAPVIQFSSPRPGRMQPAATVEPGRIRIGAAANRAAGAGRAIQPRPAVSRGRRRRLLRAAGRLQRRAGRPARRVSDDETFKAWGLWTATVWSEECEGTNGIGTCLAEQRALTVHRDQHFYARNTLLSCTSAPIYDHEGRLAAALDVSSCRADLTEGFVSSFRVAVGDAARRIEMENFRLAFPNARLLLAPGHQSWRRRADRGRCRRPRHRCDTVGAAGARRDAGFSEEAAAAASDLLGGTSSPARISTRPSGQRVQRALARSDGNVSAAAEALGISRATLHRKLRRLDLHRAH